MNGIVRAGLHARLAADADAGIEVDDAIFSLVHGRDRAYPYTGWVGTMVAAGDLKMAPVVGKDACFHIFDPGAINTQGHFIFAFTGGRTGVATNTLAIVNDEAVIHKFLLPRSLKLSNDDESEYFEVDADITLVNIWETLYFDYSNFDLTGVDFNTLSFFLDGGNTDDPQTYYFEDIKGPSLGSATSIQSINQNAIKVWPNPAVQFIQLNGRVEGDTYEIYNITGAKVQDGIFKNNPIEVSTLNSGVYFIKIDDCVVKFIKK